jgi:glyoxylase-like metal-dependent hydrolase (beta-lactamase superfamily II)
MKIEIIETGYFKLDGGAMFGVVPKSMWQRLNPPDDKNLCTWSMRCLLIDTGSRVILIDTGIGGKQDAKFMSHFEPHGEASLLESLKAKGYPPDSITDVFITHLHFDHVGGACEYDADGKIVPTFPNATYWSNEQHYDWAFDPNPREAASFLKENFVPLREGGVLDFIPVKEEQPWHGEMSIDFYHGHTEALMVPTLHLPNGNALSYAADLLPSQHHVGLPYVMSYDIRPLVTMEEKKRFFDKAIAKDHYIYFEHDPTLACGKLVLTDRGRYAIEPVDFNSIIH